MYLSNSDQRKYGTLMKQFKTQYALGNNQYCTSISDAKDVLTNQTWDDTYKESMKCKSQQKAETKTENKSNNNDKDDSDKSFAQTRKKPQKW